jgi:hypothetical protein
VLHKDVAAKPAREAEDHSTVLEDTSLTSRLGQRQKQVQQVLTSPRSQSPRQETEMRCVLGELLDHLGTMARLLPAERRLTEPLEQRLLGFLDRLGNLLPNEPKQPFNQEGTQELSNELHCVLLEVAVEAERPEYLRVRLDQEHHREKGEQSETRWSHLFETNDLAALRNAMAPGGPTSESASGATSRTVEMLTTLYQTRSNHEREQWAHDRLRDARLQWVGRWLLQLLVSVVILLPLAFTLSSSTKHPQWLENGIVVTLVAVTGALGGALSGVRRLLGTPILRGELERFQSAFRAQLLVGGTLGLISLLLFQVGSLPTFQAIRGFPTVAPLAIYAFLAGFSEPFIFGIVQGLIGGRSPSPSDPSLDRGFAK